MQELLNRFAPLPEVRSATAIMNIKEELLKLCLDGDFDQAKQLLSDSRGIVDINHDDGNLIYMAVKTGKLEAVKFLVENGVDFHIGNECPLQVAGGWGHEDIVDYLLSKGANPKVMLYTSAYGDSKIKAVVDKYL